MTLGTGDMIIGTIRGTMTDGMTHGVMIIGIITIIIIILLTITTIIITVIPGMMGLAMAPEAIVHRHTIVLHTV